MHDFCLDRVPYLTSAGRIARRAMRDGARGTVRAVFSHSFYIVLDEQWICIGPQTLGQGPLNALWSGSGAFQLPTGGAPVTIAGDMLMVGGRTFAHIRLGPQLLPTVPRRWTASNLSHGLRACDHLAETLAPREGLSPLIFQPLTASGYTVVVKGPVAYLHELVVARARENRTPHVDPAKLVPLLGLGPGLTPSGDDLLGGALVALTAVGYSDLRDAIWSRLRGEAPARTNEISLAHLDCAAQGECAAALKDAIEALLSGAGPELAPALGAVKALGHTSGWDSLVGVVVVLRAVLAQATLKLLTRVAQRM
jgi:hypothetical protein